MIFMDQAFNNNKYLEIQRKAIIDRANQFHKLYLEVGGKLFDDLHASRVLPGFRPENKMSVILSLKEESEIIIVINSEDIKNRKIRNDLNITYDVEVERLIIAYNHVGISVNSVVFSFYEPNPEVDKFIRKLKRMKIATYKHYKIAGYPQNTAAIVSESGLGKNEYIKTEKRIIIVTAPGPGSGKMATCLSQLYHDNKNGIISGYAKYETFPVWNLPLSHPVNIAYEAATIDLNDVNMIDPFHLEAYNTPAVNYNRDIEVFPLLKNIFTLISGSSPYASPTDMGVNMVGFAIENNEEVEKASKDEVIRRYFSAQKDLMLGKIDETALEKSEMLMNRLGISVSDRKCVKAAVDRSIKEDVPAMAIELKDGRIITGKRTELLMAPSAMVLNALKASANIPDKLPLISPSVIEPIQQLKIDGLKNTNPKIHLEEILIALAIQATSNPVAELALKELENLRGLEAHSSCLLAAVDLKTLNKMGIHVTEEPQSYLFKRKENN